jgi:hypothetical protein
MRVFYIRRIKTSCLTCTLDPESVVPLGFKRFNFVPYFESILNRNH